MNTPPSAKGPNRLLLAWQLSLLRYAVTRDESDRLNVAALAAELDRPGQRDDDGSLHFFRRTSSQLCRAITGQQENAADMLEEFCRRIDDSRLRLAFSAAAGLTPQARPAAKPRPKPNHDLFRGLPVRVRASL